MKQRIILASASPQRKQLLSNLFDEFEIITAAVDEKLLSYNPKKETTRLSQLKAQAVCSQSEEFQQALIIAADTLVYAQGKLLGKPQTREEASQMLEWLSKAPHKVVTGFTLQQGEKKFTSTVTTKIWMTPLSPLWKEWYLNTMEWQGAAGGYRIQGAGETLFSKLKGSYSNVVGLPMAELRLGIESQFPDFLSLS